MTALGLFVAVSCGQPGVKNGNCHCWCVSSSKASRSDDDANDNDNNKLSKEYVKPKNLTRKEKKTLDTIEKLIKIVIKAPILSQGLVDAMNKANKEYKSIYKVENQDNLPYTKNSSDKNPNFTYMTSRIKILHDYMNFEINKQLDAIADLSRQIDDANNKWEALLKSQKTINGMESIINILCSQELLETNIPCSQEVAVEELVKGAVEGGYHHKYVLNKKLKEDYDNLKNKLDRKLNSTE